MSSRLGFGIARTASNQLFCEVCNGYVSLCWAKKLGACKCADLEQRERLLGAWKTVGREKNATWNRRSRRRRPYTVSYSLHLFLEMKDSQGRFHSEVNDFLSKGKTMEEALDRVCNEWNSRETSRKIKTGAILAPSVSLYLA